jgi:hypothetical protein
VCNAAALGSIHVVDGSLRSNSILKTVYYAAIAVTNIMRDFKEWTIPFCPSVRMI